ncbi:UDP-diphosphatase [Desulfonema ishimotonii]|uniref:Undecaprenyl-diphosphatase n=1 Tax=Desulfonema ishimotonii TaxID=45657 RepID=A0A401G281_9BACT|nr:undecaprenyl-diphosphate phosphatase [Desulfonema ishimotonii]GBC63330.1 UDP-diphosphatase [Desulfonema ishimotonii]
MEPIQAIVLGIVQGLTEFLPVSSSGHLVLFQQLFGLREAEIFFDISVHMGTLVAVIIFFWRDIGRIIFSLCRFTGQLARKEATVGQARNDSEVRIALLIIAGSVPTAIIGLMFHEIADVLFSSVPLVGGMLILTGFLLWGTRRLNRQGAGVGDFSVRSALIIGTVQGLAILPGISRSGSTIATGLFLGLDKELAARYSFLLSVPAIVGAQILSLKNLAGHGALPDMPVLLGTLTAFIVGYGALALLVYIVKKGQMHTFAPYCWLVGAVTLIVGW